jgi:hypothetical protein
MVTTTIWFKNPTDFFSFSKLYAIFPLDKMTLDEKLNTYLRLAMYLSTIYYIMFQDVKVFSVIVMVMIITYVYYNSIHENYVQYEQLKHNMKTKQEPQMCEYPKKNNPFMNVLMNEYAENPERNEACDVDNDHVKTLMNDTYYKDTFRDIDDVFDKKSSFRHFYTMPNTTIPNNQEDYSHWLYGIKEKTHKEGNGDRNMQYAKHY